MSDISKRLNRKHEVEVIEALEAARVAANKYIRKESHSLNAVAGWVEGVVRVTEGLNDDAPLPDETREILNQIQADIRTLKQAGNFVWYEIGKLIKEQKKVIVDQKQFPVWKKGNYEQQR